SLCPGSFIGRITLHNCAVHILDQIFDQIRIQVVASRFACRQLHCRIFSCQLHSQSFIGIHQTLWTNLCSHVNSGYIFHVGRLVPCHMRLMFLCIFHLSHSGAQHGPHPV